MKVNKISGNVSVICEVGQNAREMTDGVFRAMKRDASVCRRCGCICGAELEVIIDRSY